MDNLLDYIIALFFILSLLGSLGKKKKQGQRKKTTAETADDFDANDYKYQKSDQHSQKSMPKPAEGWGQPASVPSPKDIFDIIFNEKSAGENENKPESEQMETWDPAKEFEKKIPEPEMHTEIPEVDYDKLPALDERKLPQKSSFDKYITGTRQDLNAAYEYNILKAEKAAELKKRLMNKQSIREFFILSEILNKPKALRR